jgi:hypothetical protein
MDEDNIQLLSLCSCYEWYALSGLKVFFWLHELSVLGIWPTFELGATGSDPEQW